MDKRPNLVFIHTDHQAFYQWQDYPVQPQRPNFERVVKAGVSFDNAYCATPLCGPTRRTLLTGLYAHSHKQAFNNSQAPYSHEVYLQTLADAGYQSYYFGKWHAGPGCALDFCTGGVCHTDYGNPYVQDDYKAYLRENGLPEAMFDVTHVLGAKDFRYGEPGSVYEDLVEGNHRYQCKDPTWCGEHAAGLMVSPRETHEAFYLAARARRQLEEIAAQGPGAGPFSLRVDFWGPHQPYFPTQEYLDLYKDVQFPEYPSWNSQLEEKPESYHRERNRPMGKDNRLIIPNAVPWSYYNDLLQRCAAHITMVDAAAGIVLDALENLGLGENTLVVFSTDHGDSLASHGGHFDKASFMCQEVLRIPLAMCWKGHIHAGSVCHAPVCSVSYPATLLDAAGLRFTKNKVHGQSLLPLAVDPAAPAPAQVVCETYGHGFGEEITSRVIVRGRYKYVATLQSGYNDELYDLENDRYEMHNLIEEAEYAPVVQELRCHLLQWQQDTDDPVVFDWSNAAGA